MTNEIPDDPAPPVASSPAGGEEVAELLAAIERHREAGWPVLTLGWSQWAPIGAAIREAAGVREQLAVGLQHEASLRGAWHANRDRAESAEKRLAEAEALLLDVPAVFMSDEKPEYEKRWYAWKREYDARGKDATDA